MLIQNKKVLIITGAGGGQGLGLPTNIGLLDEILSLVNIKNKNLTIKELEEAGFENPENLVLSLYDALLFGPPGSIDSLLIHRPDLIDIGKYLITKVLMKYETDLRFMPYTNVGDEKYAV